MSRLSIIIPTLNEAALINKTLSALMGKGYEVIIVDGGSTDQTLSICKQYTDKILSGDKGRAQQMNLGAKHASNEILVFLHADTFLPSNAEQFIDQALKHKRWGRFNIRLKGNHILLRWVEFFMNIRSCLTGIATGDQAIFVCRDSFSFINGFRNIPLMEDIELSKSLKKISRPACVRVTVTSSSRRWETQGYIKTILLMWRLRLLYFLGVPASQLVKQYYK